MTTGGSGMELKTEILIIGGGASGMAGAWSVSASAARPISWAAAVISVKVLNAWEAQRVWV